MSKTTKSAIAAGLDAVRIRSIVSVPLLGESPKGGWPTEIRPEDPVHSLIAVHTDAGIVGYGSAFTNDGLVAAAREAAGPDARLFVDAGASDAYWPHGLKWALRTAEMLKNYDIGWFEEPLKPDALEDFCELRRRSPVPIAGGEVLTRRQSFIPWLRRGAFDIVQPDVTKVGGISEQRRIAWLAYDFGVKYIGHGWNTALGVAADLQLAAALPDVDLVEFIGGSAYVDGITETPFALDGEGYLTIPTAPGLGVALDREKLARVTRDPAPLFSR